MEAHVLPIAVELEDDGLGSHPVLVISIEPTLGRGDLGGLLRPTNEDRAVGANATATYWCRVADDAHRGQGRRLLNARVGSVQGIAQTQLFLKLSTQDARELVQRNFGPVIVNPPIGTAAQHGGAHQVGRIATVGAVT